jgi:citrate lyase subunit beta/citryl-CoA lyase
MTRTVSQITEAKLPANDLPIWRSLLFIPANVERFLAKAGQSGADAIILDLEDSIAPSEKAAARAALAQAVATVAATGLDVVVRINRPWRLTIRDLEAAALADVAAIALPKVADAGHIGAVSEVLDELESERGIATGRIRLIAMIETAAAYFHMSAIAKASPRVMAMTLGSEDFALDMGMPAEADGLEQATRQTVLAARAAGIMPLGFVGSLADYRDLVGFETMARRGRALGFEGAFCIHPAQVDILNRSFGPTDAEIDHARRVIETFEQALAKGQGAVGLDGVMLDGPVVERARRLLGRHDAITKRTANKSPSSG